MMARRFFAYYRAVPFHAVRGSQRLQLACLKSAKLKRLAEAAIKP